MHRLLLALLVASSALLSGSAVAASRAGTNVGGQSKAVSLHGKDLDTMRTMACSQYGVDVATMQPAKRWTYGKGFAPEIEVAVRCAPHATVNDRPAHYNVVCRRDDDQPAGDWQCLGWEAIVVPTTIGDISVEPGPYSHEFATRTIHEALDSSLFRRDVRDALPTGCRLASNWDGSGQEVAELSCASGHRFLFSFFCPQGKTHCPRLMTATSPGP
ncbi:hypothetical protein [Solimonas marina]|uniref:Secreted protein n=1 Tax=Solimonas marina TaxID=2714601 RepID=A0A969W7I2_9GAMM|nr:hypothetical protein [Solimonas marina]NKF22121.1 hypothetical protein [Solimonas marina]